MLYQDKKIEEVEYIIYTTWFNEFLKDIPPINTIYVRTVPEIAKQRVDARARKGETIPLEYLQLCHVYHEKWLFIDKEKSKDILILDGDIDIHENPEIIDNWVEKIQNKWISN